MMKRIFAALMAGLFLSASLLIAEAAEKPIVAGISNATQTQTTAHVKKAKKVKKAKRAKKVKKAVESTTPVEPTTPATK